jgi:hypothetical protein
MFLKLFLIPFLYTAVVVDALTQFSRYIGSTEIIVLFDKTPTSFTFVEAINNKVYIVGVTDGTSTSVLCRLSVTNQIIISPKGCDPSGLIHHFCSDDDGTAFSTLQSTWWYSYGSIYGLVSGDAQIVTPPFHPDTTEFYIRTCTGPSCSIPAITWVNPERPQINVTGNLEFLGTYSYYPMTVIDDNTTVNFRRDNSLSLLYFLRLHRQEDILYWVQLVHLDTIVHSSLTPVRMPLLDHMIVPMTGNTTVTLTFISAPTHPTLRNPDIPSDLTYTTTPEVPFYYTTRTCNFGVGRLSRDRELVFPERPYSVPFGGKPSFFTSGVVGIPYHVDADPLFADWEFDACTKFYPKSSTFMSYSGATYFRTVASTFSCYSPFIWNALIDDLGTIESKWDQCKRLGGVLENDACVTTSSITQCKRGWMFFDERCYKKWSNSVDGSKRVRQNDAERTCISENQWATSVHSITDLTRIWLVNWYSYWKDPNQVRVLIKGRSCKCFDSVHGTTDCSCEELFFPLCSYHHKDVPLPFTEIHMDPYTLTILRDGQDGIAHGGKELSCECFAGSCGHDCS